MHFIVLFILLGKVITLLFGCCTAAAEIPILGVDPVSIKTNASQEKDVAASSSSDATATVSPYRQLESSVDEFFLKGMDVIRNFQRQMDSLERANEAYRSELRAIGEKCNSVFANAVPIGFIYTQYGGQEEPCQLWPGFKWREVTSQYAGQFFRALGGDSAHFGLRQEQEVPRISRLETHHITVGQQHHGYNIPATKGSTDHRLFTGADSGGNFWALKVHVEGKEVRPVNQAIKIWKRTA